MSLKGKSVLTTFSCLLVFLNLQRYILRMKILNIMLILLFVTSAAYSVTVRQVFPELSAEQLTTLKKDGELTRYYFKGGIPRFLFNTPYSQQLVSDIKKLDINIGVESVYFFKMDKNISLLDIYNTLLSISSMKGIDYYSQTRKKFRTLYSDSHVITGKTNTAPLPDPKVIELQKFKQIYIEQTDTTFGKNIYKTTYRTDGNVLWVEMTNETPMYFSFIRMVDKENISIDLLIKKTDNGLIFYGSTNAKTFSFFGIERKNKESFYNRTKALYKWFVHQIESKYLAN